MHLLTVGRTVSGIDTKNNYRSQREQSQVLHHGWRVWVFKYAR